MIYKNEKAREEVIRAGLGLKKTGLIARTWGNVSARISETSFVITPSGRAYESLSPEDLVEVRIQGAVPEGPGKPSSEKGVHAECYRLRPDVGFVVHTHQTYATMLATLGRDVEGIPCAAYGMSGTDVLSSHVAGAIETHPGCRAVLMQNHGAVCMGADYDEAFRAAFELEEKARRIYLDLCGEILHKTGFEFPVDKEKPVTEHTEPLNAERTILRVRSPYIRLTASYGKDLIAYIDDFGMMFGEKVRCLPHGTGDKEALSTLGGEGAVLIAGGAADAPSGDTQLSAGGSFGTSPVSAHIVSSVTPGYALVSARIPDDAEAMAILLEKNCQAQLLMRAGARPIPVVPSVARAEHRFYIEKYRGLA